MRCGCWKSRISRFDYAGIWNTKLLMGIYRQGIYVYCPNVPKPQPYTLRLRFRYLGLSFRFRRTVDVGLGGKTCRAMSSKRNSESADCRQQITISSVPNQGALVVGISTDIRAIHIYSIIDEARGHQRRARSGIRNTGAQTEKLTFSMELVRNIFT